MEVPDQRPVWDEKHRNGDHTKLRGVPSPFSEIAEPYFSRQSSILELGCGVGRDAVYFAEQGHSVLATDGSAVVTSQNRDQIDASNITFDTLDMREPFPYEDGRFDVVYANLALHYYSDEVTNAIVAEALRVLKPSGIFAFACKSYDTMHNAGQEIEPNLFVSPNGQTIHLFSLDYAKKLVSDQWSIEHLDEVGEDYNGRFSKIIRCIARRK